MTDHPPPSSPSRPPVAVERTLPGAAACSPPCLDGRAGRLRRREGQRDGSAATPDGKVEDSLNVYSWADYDDPDNLKAFEATGPKLQVDSYAPRTRR